MVDYGYPATSDHNNCIEGSKVKVDLRDNTHTYKELAGYGEKCLEMALDIVLSLFLPVTKAKLQIKEYLLLIEKQKNPYLLNR